MTDEKRESFVEISDETPEFTVPVNWVSIANRKVYVNIKDQFSTDSHPMRILCDLTLSLSLAHDRRGAHMSRIEEKLGEVSVACYETLQDFASHLAVEIYNSQPCVASRVLVKGYCSRSVNTPKTGLKTQQVLTILSHAIFDGKCFKKKIGLIVPIIIACPCCMRTIQDLTKRKKLKTNTSDFAFSPTHTQRGLVTVIIEHSTDELDVKELLTLIEEVTIPTCDLLKRSDETEIVLKVLQKPQLVEDISREIIVKLYETYNGKLPDKTVIQVGVLSFESIHSYNLRANIRMSLKEIRHQLQFQRKGSKP